MRYTSTRDSSVSVSASEAIAAGLARGQGLASAVKSAKRYLTGALEAMLDLGQGSGPLNHAYKITD